MAKDVASGEKIIMPKSQVVDPRELARRIPTCPPQRKLPPEPGSTPRQTYIPDDEILPRGS
jgi:hypothetical protein